MKIYLDKVEKLCKLNSEIFLKTKSTEMWILYLFFLFYVILMSSFLKEENTLWVCKIGRWGNIKICSNHSFNTNVIFFKITT